MELLNCSMPFPQHIMVLFNEVFKYDMPYDVIRFIWEIYKNIEPHFAKNLKLQMKSQYYVTYLLGINNECYYQTGPIDIKIILASKMGDNIHFKLRALNSKCNDVYMEFLHMVDNYFDSMRGRRVIFDTNPQKYNYLPCINKQTDSSMIECFMNIDIQKFIVDVNYLENLTSVDVIIKVSHIRIPYEFFIDSNVYYPEFEILDIKKIEI